MCIAHTSSTNVGGTEPGTRTWSSEFRVRMGMRGLGDAYGRVVGASEARAEGRTEAREEASTDGSAEASAKASADGREDAWAEG